MAKRVGVDKWLFGVTIILVVIGLLMVFSASAVMAKARDGSPYHFVILQSIWAALGLLAMTVLMKVDYRRYNGPNIVFPAVAFTTLLLLITFFMHDSHGASRWIRVGPASFQPSEIAKPVLVLFLAWFLQNRMGAIEDFRGTILPAVLPSLIFIALILKEPDFGTALVCAAVTALMLYLAGLNWRYLFYAALLSTPVLYFMLFRVAWRRERILAFLNPESDPLGKGFHIIQSLIAVGTGGIHGLGYMEGRQKLFYLPEPHTDYIFANIAEELGLIGAILVVSLFVAIGYRGMRAAVLSKDPFARFLAFGITATLLIQAFFNISVVLALVPTKGITLPLVSYGGTSLFIVLASLGVLLNITREVDWSVRVAIAGGGTGGHIIPALAIARELTSACGAEVLFIGTPRGLESRLVPQAGYRLELIEVGQLKNVSLATKARTLLDLPLSLIHCRRLLRQFRPDAVVGVGGYASGPAMAAAILSGIPTLAFEPNAIPGLANRIIGKRVRAAAVNFAPAAKYFRNAHVTGIPVRPEFFQLQSRPADAPPHLLIFGGSQGARVLNSLMPKVAPGLLAVVPGLTILHQAGARHAESTLAAYQASGAQPDRWQVHAFLDDMPRRFEAADLVLARSGASTVAELAAAGKPSLLVPFPQAADDHQRKNAEVLAQAGAAQVIVEKELTPELLQESLIRLLGSRFALEQMSEQARKLAHPDATASIVALVESIAVAKSN